MFNEAYKSVVVVVLLRSDSEHIAGRLNIS